MIILFFLILKAQTAKPGFATKTLWSKVFLSPRMLKQFISLGENKHYCTLSGICLVSEHVLFAAQPPLWDIPPSSISRLFIVAAVWVLVSALWSFFFFFKPPSWLLNPNLSPALVCSVSQCTSKPFVGVVVAERETKQNYKWWANIHDNMRVFQNVYLCTKYLIFSVYKRWKFVHAESYVKTQRQDGHLSGFKALQVWNLRNDNRKWMLNKYQKIHWSAERDQISQAITHYVTLHIQTH